MVPRERNSRIVRGDGFWPKPSYRSSFTKRHCCQEVRQPDNVLVPYEHLSRVENLYPPFSQPLVGPTVPIGILAADPHRTPPDGEQTHVLRPPHPARHYPLEELLGLGYVFLDL